MHPLENLYRQKILEIVFIVKLLALLFCGVIFFSTYFNFKPINNIYDSFIIIICLFVLSFLYSIWMFICKNRNIFHHNKVYIILEILLFIVVFFLLIIISGAYTSPYKCLFLLIIITTSIELGITYGVTISLICSSLILFLDIFAIVILKRTIFIEIDLVIIGIFILTAWLLGFYVNVESQHREEIISLANIDELTGLNNHRVFQNLLNIKIEESKQTGEPISLLFIDIDYFKNYNDIYGHQAGDNILRQIGTFLKSNLSEKSIPARYGGEEFAIILPNHVEEDAVFVAENLRNNIEVMPFEGEENLPHGKLTVSIGVSCFPYKASCKLDLIKSADDALYRAKFFNKNRVEVYSSVLEELKHNLKEEDTELISSIKTLISVINAKDRYTYAHTERVVMYCNMFAHKLNLSEHEKKILKYGSYLHDIGKINISENILNKRMPLNDEEWSIIQEHPQKGVDIIKTVESVQAAIPIIKYHHERYDGTGYPIGLKGEEIPFLARILTIADCFDAMTSSRPYNKRKTIEEGIEEIKRCSGIQFDPAIVDAFAEMVVENIIKA